MYTTNAITLLKDLIGFGAFSADPGFVLSDTLKEGADGRLFSNFHQLVTPDNIYKCVSKPGMSRDEFEAKLEALTLNASKKALSNVLDQNKAYIDEFNYDATVELKTPLFEEVVGYLVAISVLELLLSTERSNLEAINADLTEAKLNLQINGYKTEKGVVVAVGLQGKLHDAIMRAQRVIFKNNVNINRGEQW